jgi:hypothetical protein
MNEPYVTTEFKQNEGWLWIWFRLHESNAPAEECYEGGYKLGGIQVRDEDKESILDDLKRLGWFNEADMGEGDDA